MTNPAPFTKAYIELCFHIDGGQNLFLRIPTVRDINTKNWVGFIKTPISRRLIYAQGKDSREIEEAFLTILAETIQESEELGREILSMLQPLSYWEEMNVSD